MFKKETHSTQRMEAECCIFMLFLRFRMLSDDWYTWILTQNRGIAGNQVIKSEHRQEKEATFLCVTHHPSSVPSHTELW